MKEITSNPKLVAYCGLYCGACRRYLKGGCPGCHENEKASWCKIRSCCKDDNYLTCAECKEFPEPNDCDKFNNFMARIFGFIFRSDRVACINKIREVGVQGYADFMTENRMQSIKR
jgi:hypothetical protein